MTPQQPATIVRC